MWPASVPYFDQYTHTEAGVLPGGEEEDAADGEVGQQHEEPDSRRERIQEGEVTWFTTLKHTRTKSFC